MIVKLLTEHHLEFLSLKGGYRGSSQSTHVKCHIVRNHMPRLKWLSSCHIRFKNAMNRANINYLMTKNSLIKGPHNAFNSDGHGVNVESRREDICHKVTLSLHHI